MHLRRLIKESRRVIAENTPPQVGVRLRIDPDKVPAPQLLALVKDGVDLPTSARGEWEIYNVTHGMIHMGRLKGGSKAPPSKANMLNVTPLQFNSLINAGVFQPL